MDFTLLSPGFKVKVWELESTGVAVKDHSELYKIIKKMRPDSPDVIRAAKRFKCTHSRLNSDNGLETIIEQSPQPTRKSYIEARSPNDRYYRT